MLACKAKMFQKAEDYDEFSLYSATKVLIGRFNSCIAPKLSRIDFRLFISSSATLYCKCWNV